MKDRIILALVIIWVGTALLYLIDHRALYTLSAACKGVYR
jgi:hypothetical protein